MNFRTTNLWRNGRPVHRCWARSTATMNSNPQPYLWIIFAVSSCPFNRAIPHHPLPVGSSTFLARKTIGEAMIRPFANSFIICHTETIMEQSHHRLSTIRASSKLLYSRIVIPSSLGIHTISDALDRICSRTS